jgi:hypothetical protein
MERNLVHFSLEILESPQLQKRLMKTSHIHGDAISQLGTEHSFPFSVISGPSEIGVSVPLDPRQVFSPRTKVYFINFLRVEGFLAGAASL